LDVTKDVAFLSEYAQWVAVRKQATADTSPEEFMKDRLKQVAYDRLEQVMDYMDSDQPHYPDVIRAMLKGTYNEQSDSEGAADSEAVRGELTEREEATA
jgi:hypothetical protein